MRLLTFQMVRGDAEYGAWSARPPPFGVGAKTATQQDAIEITGHAVLALAQDERETIAIVGPLYQI